MAGNVRCVQETARISSANWRSTRSRLRTTYITPALVQAGWQDKFLEEVSFTDGRIYVRGQMTARGKAKRADYILYYKPNIPIAIVEAKDNRHALSDGMQQALDYARILDIPCVFASNGDGFLFHDRTATDENIERELALDAFPTPDDLHYACPGAGRLAG